MLNVNGVMVRVVTSPAKRCAKGWLHSTAVYHERGEYLGVVERISTRKGAGGSVSDSWVRVGSFRDGEPVAGGNVNDLVARWRAIPAASLSRERGVCPSCHAETRPGEQLYNDGSCWPQCLGAAKPEPQEEKHLCGRCGNPGAAGAAGLCSSCDAITDPPLLLMVNGSIISGARDALVTLRSAINEALAKGRGRADVEDEDGDEFHVTVERVGS
jgi:hypothetical protein